MNFTKFTERIEKVIEFAIIKSVDKYLNSRMELKNPIDCKNEESELLTTEEVILFLKVTRGTICNLIKRNQLYPIKISSRKNLFKKEDVEKLIQTYKKRTF